MRWRVRRANADDAAAVRAIAAAGWRDAYRSLLLPETIEAFLAGPYALDSVRHRFAADDFFVADGPDGIAAFADALPEDERIFLAALYARPELRRQGAGTALLDAVAALRPLPIDAYVLVGNRPGEGFYERRGFVPEETIAGDLFGEKVTERRWRRAAARLLP
jgi:GNAT superfamily N-acetyltransferase